MFIPALPRNIVYDLSYFGDTLANRMLFNIICASSYHCDITLCWDVFDMPINLSSCMPGIDIASGMESSTVDHRSHSSDDGAANYGYRGSVDIRSTGWGHQVFWCGMLRSCGCTGHGSMASPLAASRWLSLYAAGGAHARARDIRNIWQGVKSILSGHCYPCHLLFRLVDLNFRCAGHWWSILEAHCVDQILEFAVSLLWKLQLLSEIIIFAH